MGQYHVSVSRAIDAPIETVYAILSDYREGHPAVLPPAYFKRLTVLEGGHGTGTVAEVEMNVMGSRQTFLLHVSEPVPGRVLMEEDRTAGTVTRFTLDALEEGRTRVTITTDSRTAGGLRGFMERLVNPAVTRRIYNEELTLLEATARQWATGSD